MSEAGGGPPPESGPDPDPQTVTRLLRAAGEGDQAASHELYRLVYDRLRTMASQQLGRERRGATETCSLIHDVYMRLSRGKPIEWANRRHFFAIAAITMRRIRVERARRRRDGQPLEWADWMFGEDDPDEMIELDEALDRLAAIDPEAVQIIHLRYFVGLTIDQTARALECSPRKVDAKWAIARAWLHRELRPDTAAS